MPEPFPQPGLPSKTKVMSFSREYQTDIITLFHATGDFNHRSRWQEGVKYVEEVGHYLPRVGMKCRCVMDDGQTVVYSSSYSFSRERIEFSETDEKKMSSTYFTLVKTGDTSARLTIDVYVRKNPIRQVLYALTKKKEVEAMYSKSLFNLEALVKEMDLPS
jgi:hypothetical protein